MIVAQLAGWGLGRSRRRHRRARYAAQPATMPQAPQAQPFLAPYYPVSPYQSGYATSYPSGPQQYVAPPPVLPPSSAAAATAPSGTRTYRISTPMDALVQQMQSAHAITADELKQDYGAEASVALSRDQLRQLYLNKYPDGNFYFAF